MQTSRLFLITTYEFSDQKDQWCVKGALLEENDNLSEKNTWRTRLFELPDFLQTIWIQAEMMNFREGKGYSIQSGMHYTVRYTVLAVVEQNQKKINFVVTHQSW